MPRMTPEQYFSQPFWQDRFHLCAFDAYITAAAKGKHTDSEYVRSIAYEKYEQGKRK